MSSVRRGTLFGIAAYVMWGIFPLYFPLLEPATPLEILAHRIVWSLVIVGAIVLARRRVKRLFSISRRQFTLLSIAAVLLAINWGTYVYGVNSGQVVETSLGYFINPLVTVCLGVVVLHERLRPAQWTALGLALLAVVILTVDYARPPWIALTLACSFGFYGLMKKQAHVGAVESLTTETGVLFLPAAAYLAFLAFNGTQTFTSDGSMHVALLVTLGAVTAAPLVCFGAAATRIPLTTLGLLQYIAPTLQFLIGVLILSEPMPRTRWVGFCIVWVALVILTADSLHSARARRASAAGEPVAAVVP
jgi:chloramphenicol-sensitive protein RarD